METRMKIDQLKPGKEGIKIYACRYQMKINGIDEE